MAFLETLARAGTVNAPFGKFGGDSKRQDSRCGGSFELQSEGEFKMTWGYENCDENGDTRFDEEEYMRLDEQRRQRANRKIGENRGQWSIGSGRSTGITT